MAVFPGRCAQRCVGNDTCACFDGYKLKPDEKTCEGMSPLKIELEMFHLKKQEYRQRREKFTITQVLYSNPLRYQRVFAGCQQLSWRRAVYQHRGLVPLPERGQLRDWL